MVGDAKGKKFYQYTAIDEYSRFRYLEAFEEHMQRLTQLKSHAHAGKILKRISAVALMRINDRV